MRESCERRTLDWVCGCWVANLNRREIPTHQQTYDKGQSRTNGPCVGACVCKCAHAYVNPYQSHEHWRPRTDAMPLPVVRMSDPMTRRLCLIVRSTHREKQIDSAKKYHGIKRTTWPWCEIIRTLLKTEYYL